MKTFNRLLLIATFFLSAASVTRAQVYGNSRHRASANPSATRRIGTGAGVIRPSNIGNGRPLSGVRTYVPGLVRGRGISLSYSNARGPSRNNHVHGYSAYPGYQRYSLRTFSSYGVSSRHSYPGYTQIHPNVIVYGMPPLVTNYGAYNGVYPAIVAPPITIPYAGFSTTIGVNSPSVVTPSNVTPELLPPVAPALSVENGDTNSKPMTVDEQSVVNEFPAAIMAETNSPAADRIRSLRYETTGDGAFRRGDYSTAEAFYETAAETAPERRAAWLRLAWTQVATQQFDDAAVNLKQALAIETDSTFAWTSGDELYGQRINSDAVLENERLLKWLELRPNSTDRLLLASAFQSLVGRTGIARELLDYADRNGGEPKLIMALRQIRKPQQSTEKAPGTAPEKILTIPDEEVRAAPHGIQIHGRDNQPVPSDSDSVGPPVPIAPARSKLP